MSGQPADTLSLAQWDWAEQTSPLNWDRAVVFCPVENGTSGHPSSNVKQTGNWVKRTKGEGEGADRHVGCKADTAPRRPWGTRRPARSHVPPPALSIVGHRVLGQPATASPVLARKRLSVRGGRRGPLLKSAPRKARCAYSEGAVVRPNGGSLHDPEHVRHAELGPVSWATGNPRCKLQPRSAFPRRSHKPSLWRPASDVQSDGLKNRRPRCTSPPCVPVCHGASRGLEAAPPACAPPGAVVRGRPRVGSPSGRRRGGALCGPA